MDFWLLKLLLRDMKSKTKNSDQPTENHKKTQKNKSHGKYNTYHWSTLQEMDRCEISIINLIRHVNPGNE